MTYEHDEFLVKRLHRPSGPVDVVFDSDAYNEVDDQYALAYLIHSAEKLKLQAIYASPFHNEKSSGPEEGMELSYKEIRKILGLMGRDDLESKLYKGSPAFLPSETEPVVSPAAAHLSELATRYSPDNPLYVICIAAITNIASALLMKPEIKDNIVVVWLGGHAFDWHNNREFNIRQDVAAARVIFDSGVPVVLLPCKGVVSSFNFSGPELEANLRGKNPLCDYLVDVTTKEARACGGGACWTRVIWDVTAVAWLLDDSFTMDRLERSPIAQHNNYYSFDPRRHLIRYVYHINRDAIAEDLFEKLALG